MKLENKAILITGASRGLGEAIARKLASKNTKLVLVARDREPLDRLVEDLRTSGNKNIFGISADVGKKEVVYPLVAEAASLVGPIQVLINNASTLGPVPLRPLLDTECEDLMQVLETNLVGPFRLIKALMGPMILRGDGLIVNVSSDAAVSAYSTWGSYSVSKIGLDHLTRILAEETKMTRVKVISVDPGEMDTRMHADAIPDADIASLQKPEVVARNFIEIFEHLDSIKNGSRLLASDWKESHEISNITSRLSRGKTTFDRI